MERNKKVKPEQAYYQNAKGDKVTLTSEIFGERQFFQSVEDTAQNRHMQDYVMEDFATEAFVGSPDAIGKHAGEKKGKTGNVVPFFPTDW